jgi:hypothetical protein
LQQGLSIVAGERQKGKTEEERHSGEKYMEIWRKRDKGEIQKSKLERQRRKRERDRGEK